MKLLTIFLLLTIHLQAQNVPVFPSVFLPQAPYDGLEGEIDSLVVESYYIKKYSDKQLLQFEKQLENAPDYDEQRIAILKDKVYKIERKHFNQNGDITLYERLELSNKDHRKGKLKVTYRETIERKPNSLPTRRTITYNGRTSFYQLSFRNINTEVYEERQRLGRIPSIDTRKKIVVTYHNDSIVSLYSDPSGMTTKIVQELHEKTKVPNGIRITTHDGTYISFYTHYAYGQLPVEDHLFIQKPNELGNEIAKGSSYEMYEIEDGQSTLSPNWIRREHYNSTEGFFGIDEQKIHYRK